MKRAVVTSVIGHKFEEIAELSLPTIQVYANKLNADLKILTTRNPNYANYHIFWSKFCAYELLDTYDEILWIDCDAIVAPNAPSIFEAANGRFSAVPESLICDRFSFKSYCTAIDANPKIKKEGFYVNAGIFVAPRNAKHLFAFPGKYVLDITERIIKIDPNVFADQDYINFKVLDTEYPINYLPVTWNATPYVVNWKERLKSHIVHYAGQHRGDNRAVLQTMKKDIAIHGQFHISTIL